jgi:hypothetical protein
MSSRDNKPNIRIRLDHTDGVDRQFGSDLLSAWQEMRLVSDRSIREWKRGDARVTILAYYFWAHDHGSKHLDALECAILETWRLCGRMIVVIVTNYVTPPLERLATQNDGWIQLQVEPTLEPGNLFSMSIDCNSRLHRRFETDYVLIVQEDGFPLRTGLGDYIGRYDFIGAPYVRNKWHLQAFCGIFKCQVCNGGFSLRSRRICKWASEYWEKKYHSYPDCRRVSEDLFYTETLPLRERSYRKQIVIPSFEAANDFSYDAVFPYVGYRLPFGFHGALAFKLLYEAGAVERLPQEQALPGPHSP